MKYIILAIVFLTYAVMGYFLMKRLDEFIKKQKMHNRK